MNKPAETQEIFYANQQEDEGTLSKLHKPLAIPDRESMGKCPELKWRDDAIFPTV